MQIPHYLLEPSYACLTTLAITLALERKGTLCAAGRTRSLFIALTSLSLLDALEAGKSSWGRSLARFVVFLAPLALGFCVCPAWKLCKRVERGIG